MAHRFEIALALEAAASDRLDAVVNSGKMSGPAYSAAVTAYEQARADRIAVEEELQPAATLAA